MRLHYLSLLVAGAFLRSAKANSTSTNSTPSTAALINLLTAGKDDVPVLRFLTTTVTAEEKIKSNDEDKKELATGDKDDEGRAFSFGGLTNIDASKLKTLLIGKIKGREVEYVFRTYELMKAKGKLLEHENFMKWYEETKRTHSENFNEKAVSTLSRYYKGGNLYKILDAKKHEQVAKDLQKALIKRWLAKKRSPKTVYEKMGLNGSKLEDILTSPWIKYVDDFNKANPKQKTTQIEVLLTKVDAFDLTSKLEEVIQKNDGATEVAQRLIEQITKKNYKALVEHLSTT